jgi:hypothetical protein
LDEVYPLSQHETTLPVDIETVEYVATQTSDFIKRNSYRGVVLLNDRKLWNNTVKAAVKQAIEDKSLYFVSQDANVEGTREMLDRLEVALRKGLTMN